jgi:D-alanyl-D-alanine dipeptidase
MPELSGPAWVGRFPTSTSTNDLSGNFRNNVDRFISALEAGGARVSISATLRPPERAYLMHYSWRVARENLTPDSVPALAGVDIDWVHTNGAGETDLSVSRVAARQMVAGYEIVYKPALSSNHTHGRAIDMTITNYVGKTFNDASNKATKVNSAVDLHTLGATFGVKKLVSDPPHWSDNGH